MKRASTATVEPPPLFAGPAAPEPAPSSPPKPRASRAKPGTAVAEVERVPAGRQARPDNLLAAIVAAASDPGCQPEKMHALLDARKRLMAEEAHVAFVQAYINLQAELPTIDAKGRIEIEAKRADRKKQSTPYATYHEINKVTKPILRKHGFAMFILPDVGPGGVGVLMRGQLAYACDTQYGRLVHAENCAIAAPLETSGSKNNVQGVGSSLSYTKRYVAVALLNLVSQAPEDRDDDARSAGPPVEVISPDQVRRIEAAIEDCGVGTDTFCNKYGIDGVAALPVAMLDEALAACERFKGARERPADAA